MSNHQPSSTAKMDVFTLLMNLAISQSGVNTDRENPPTIQTPAGKRGSFEAKDRQKF